MIFVKGLEEEPVGQAIRRLKEEKKGAARPDSVEFLCVPRTEYKVEVTSRAESDILLSAILLLKLDCNILASRSAILKSNSSLTTSQGQDPGHLRRDLSIHLLFIARETFLIQNHEP